MVRTKPKRYKSQQQHQCHQGSSQRSCFADTASVADTIGTSGISGSSTSAVSSGRIRTGPYRTISWTYVLAMLPECLWIPPRIYRKSAMSADSIIFQISTGPSSQKESILREISVQCSKKARWWFKKYQYWINTYLFSI